MTGLRAIVALLAAIVALASAPRVQADGFALGIGLDRLRDYGTQQPFIDVMKLARPWIGHRPGQWGGMTYEEIAEAGHLDERGWPLRIPPGLGSVGTMILTDLPEDAGRIAGRYRLSFDGTGIVEVAGRAQNVRYGDNAVEFDFTPGKGGVDLRIQRTDPGRTGDHVRNISVVRLDRLAAHAEGALFNPDWLAHIAPFAALRFLDWMDVNDSTLSRWEDRPQPHDYSYALNGAPLEIMIELANRTGRDPWFTIPHLADDDFVRRFAQQVRRDLDPDLKAHAEFSNEVWNWQFDQADWAEAQGQARWGSEHAWVQYYALRASEVADIWTQVFGAEAETRLVNVIATQTGWIGLEKDILEAPLWMAERGTRRIPAEYFDAYAVTGYFGAHLGSEEGVAAVRRWISESRSAARTEGRAAGLTGAALEDHVAAHGYDRAIVRAAGHLSGAEPAPELRGDTLPRLLDEMLAHHKRVAVEHGLDLVAYEGGTHVAVRWPDIDDEDLVAFFQALNYSPQMGELYEQLFEGWRALEGGLFMAYLDVKPASRWGSWGNLRHLGDDTARWRVLQGLVSGRDSTR